MRFQGILDVIPESDRKLRRRSDDARETDHGKDAHQYVDDLDGGRTSTHRSIGLCPVGRKGTADRHQHGKTDESQRLRIELSRLQDGGTGSVVEVSVESEQSKPFGVIQSSSLSAQVTSGEITRRMTGR